MAKWTFMVLAMAVFGLPLCCSLVSAEEKAEVFEVNIVHDQQGWYIEPCPLPGDSGDTWSIVNTTTDSLCVLVLNRADGVIETTYSLGGEASVYHSIGSDDWAIAVKPGFCGGYLTFVAACSFAPTSHPSHNVTIKQEDKQWEIKPCPLPVADEWVFYDSTSYLIIVEIMYPVTDGEPQFTLIIPGWGHASFPVHMWGGAIVKVFDLSHLHLLAYCSNPDGGPTLSQWGVVALAFSLMAAAVWILSRRKTRHLTSERPPGSR